MVFTHLIAPATLFILSTASLSRAFQPTSSNLTTRHNTVPYGINLYNCSVPGAIALTFDDGPFIYTPALLDILSEYGARATFFVNGHNIYQNVPVIERIMNDGHQLASHTFGHANLAVLDYDAIVEQMTLLESAFFDIVGRIPRYMRPPYLAISDLTLVVMADLGYHVIGASVDTKDYENDHPDYIWRSVDKFMRELDEGGTIILAHDVHKQTVETLTDIMLDEIYRRGLHPVTVGQCLGDPEDKWYQ